MDKSRYKLPEDLAGLLRSEWEIIIEQAGFDAVDESIARDCLMERYTQAYAASGVDRSRVSVCRRLPYIVSRARCVAIKMKMIPK